MPLDKYISLVLEGERVDFDPNGQVPTIDYSLEDEENFEQKKAAESFNITLPPTINNQARFNSAHNPSIIDNTAQSVYERPQKAIYVANGYEVLIGKFFYESSKVKGRQITGYSGKLYGLNGDWVIDLKEKTLYDFIQPRTHTFNPATVIASWNFDGRNEATDYVYAPVRYRSPFHPIPANAGDPIEADNVRLNDMKPALSIYWLLYRGFKSVGYRMKSRFFDLDYIRRAVMPWTWGGFDYLDDSRWEPLKFLAKAEKLRIEGDYNDFTNLNVLDTYPGAFDNSNTYQWYGATASLPYSMVWIYPTAPANLNLGKLRSTFSLQMMLDYKVQNNSDVDVKVYWYKNGAQIALHNVLSVNSPTAGTRQGVEFIEDFQDVDVLPGDWIACRVHVHLFESGLGFARLETTVEQFSLLSMSLTENSVVNFKNYPKFKNYKWIDLLRGVIDDFNLQVNTDPILKEVVIEPTHEYKIGNTIYPGYYNRKQLEYSQKVDLSKEHTLELFSDYEREFIIKFKDDPQDGGLKKIQDRNQTTIGLAKYLLPERFKSGKKELENRFFAPTMHVDHDDFKYITGVSPQLIAIIPENISNTSSSESENVFQPKMAWYKGLTSGVGGWKFNGTVYQNLPFMFSVNYKAGGENDPVFSYADQKIGGAIGTGLMKKFFWQRLAIYRHGRRYNPIYLMLKNVDVCNYLHRESIIIENVEYLLTSIRQYNPIDQQSTACSMWMFAPVTERDKENTYPSIKSIQDSVTANSFDVKYWQHKLLYSDTV